MMRKKTTTFIYHVQRMNNVLDLHLLLWFLKMDMILDVLPDWQIWYIQVLMSAFPSCTLLPQWMSKHTALPWKTSRTLPLYDRRTTGSTSESKKDWQVFFFIYLEYIMQTCLRISRKCGKGRDKYLCCQNVIIICSDFFFFLICMLINHHKSGRWALTALFQQMYLHCFA